MLFEAEFVRRSVSALDRHFAHTIQEHVLALGFTLPQMRVLEAVVDHRGIGIKQLAQDLEMTQSTASDIVERLVEKGLLSKRVSERDRRAVEIWPASDVDLFMARDRTEFVNRPALDLLERLAPQDREAAVLGLRLLMAALATLQEAQA